jgi:hypothetical protein
MACGFLISVNHQSKAELSCFFRSAVARSMTKPEHSRSSRQLPFTRRSICTADGSPPTSTNAGRLGKVRSACFGRTMRSNTSVESLRLFQSQHCSSAVGECRIRTAWLGRESFVQSSSPVSTCGVKRQHERPTEKSEFFR